MKRKVTANFQLISALLSALFVGPASAGSVLIQEEPTDPSFIHPAFTINPKTGTVAVRITVTDPLGDEDSRDTDYLVLVKGLAYDRASNEIRYGDTVCAKVNEHQFLISHWYSIDETGSCAFEKRQKEVDSYTVTEVYLKSPRSESRWAGLCRGGSCAR